MTLAAFPTSGYVRDGAHLVYAEQQAITLPLSGSDGTYWVALSRDVSTAYATWTRRAGSQYLWQLAGARPPDVDGLLVFCSVTVAGGIITAVTPAPGVTRAEAWRALAALGTMATQNASAVAITGGTATLADLDVDGTTLRVDSVNHRVGIGTATPGHTLQVAGRSYFADAIGLGTAPDPLFSLLCQFNARFQALVGIGMAPPHPLSILYTRTSQHALYIQPNADTGAGTAATFLNAAAASVGSISTTASATAYNTTSDVRLKHAIATLAGALDVVAALKPVRFRWNADDSPGVGFLAHELQQVIPEAVTGEPDAVDAQGNIVPQGVDHSKLVPWLAAALQETLAQVDALTARVTSLEAALGV